MAKNMEYEWKTQHEISSTESIAEENFWNGLCVWLERPHLLNRRLLAAELLEAWTISRTNNLLNIHSNEQLLKLFVLKELTPETLHNMMENNNTSSELVKTHCIKLYAELTNIKRNKEEKDILLIRNLLPRNMKLYQDMTEISLLDNSDCSATFYPMKSCVRVYPLSPAFPYRFKLNGKRIILQIFQNMSEEKCSDDLKAEKWLASEILPKIFKWCTDRPEKPIVPSLNLISAKRYSSNLHHLKEKYGKFYEEMWPKFNHTNPLKYVYEDISICAYLITLWEEERITLNINQKQKFLDLACGNGLLVDILISEGYEGIGIDLRKRKIWDAFESRSKLIEMVIQPSNYQLPPDFDWLIGNHPDELTPWIPIIAARSSFKMKVFLMPCCFYTFNSKYTHCDAGLTRYESYLRFIKNICEVTGFKVQQDKLRIPSTKRTCFVCTSRLYNEEDEEKVDIQRSKLINEELPVSSETSIASKNRNSDFKPREKIELVRNCTAISRKLLDDIISKVVKILLHKQNWKLFERDSESVSWNAGGIANIADLIKSLEPNILTYLKNQNGGFQTLLRNHKNIFEVKGGSVQLRVPTKCTCPKELLQNGQCICKQRNNPTYKTKKCFFYFNHPQGCPLSMLDCTFLHEET